jgi:LPS-assembly lipoprotein
MNLHQNINKLWISLVLILSLSLTACGFHLRKTQPLIADLQVIYIKTSTPNDPFIQILSRWLIANDVQLTTDPKFASSTLNIINIQQSSNINALQGAAEAGQYVTTMTVSFDVKNSNGRVLIAPTTMTRSAYYSNNATQILSSNATANQLAVQLQQQLAQSILQQLSSVKAPTSSSSS